MKKHIKVYIIIVNYGEPQHSIECLQSILDNNYEFFHVVIVDISNINQSIDKINSWIDEKNDSRFSLINEDKNKGFAFANNIGIKHALQHDDCDYLWILNNDTIIEKESLSRLKNYYNEKKQDCNIGFVGSKIMDYDNSDIIQNIGGTFNKWSGYSVLIGMGQQDKGQFENIDINPDYIVGASMFFHSSIINKIGLMPEDYFLYYEDIDWCLSAQKAGFTNLSCSKSIVYHKQGISTGSKLLTGDKNLKNKKHLYISYLKLYKKKFKWLLPVAYIILFKQIAGKIYHRNFTEAKLILQVIINSNRNN